MNPLATLAIAVVLMLIAGWLNGRPPPPIVKLNPTEPEPEPELETYIPEHLIKRMEEIHWEYMRTRMPPKLRKQPKYYISDKNTVHPGIEDWQWDTKWQR